MDEEWSIGDYCLVQAASAAGTGVMTLDALARLIPGALNDSEESAAQDYAHERVAGLLPHYISGPEDFEALRCVPEVLLSGDLHASHTPLAHATDVGTDVVEASGLRTKSWP